MRPITGRYDPEDHFVRIGETVVQAALLEREMLFCQTLVMLLATTLRRIRVSYSHEVSGTTPKRLCEDGSADELRETLLECERRVRCQIVQFILHVPGIATPTVFAGEVTTLLQVAQRTLEEHSLRLSSDAVMTLQCACVLERTMLDDLFLRTRLLLDLAQYDDPLFGGDHSRNDAA